MKRMKGKNMKEKIIKILFIISVMIIVIGLVCGISVSSELYSYVTNLPKNSEINNIFKIFGSITIAFIPIVIFIYTIIIVIGIWFLYYIISFIIFLWKSVSHLTFFIVIISFVICVLRILYIFTLI